LCTLGILIFIRQTRNVHRELLDFVGFLTLSLGIGALQFMFAETCLRRRRRPRRRNAIATCRPA
jgi:hypothetical protein